jgi:acetyl esterase/lipase
MPRLSCWFIRASLIYLALGFTAGVWLVAVGSISGVPALIALLGRSAEAGAALAFAAHAWPRIKPPGA